MAEALQKKRYLVLILVPVFVILVALTPFLLSSSPALQFFLNAVNSNISGRISIESWLIGWQQGVLCQNVVYTDPDNGITVSIPSLTSNRGLMELILASKNLGIVHVDSPLVELSGSSVQAFFTGGNTSATGDRNIPHSSVEEMPFWDQVLVEIKSRDGVVKAKWGDQNITLAFNNVSVDSTLAAGIATFEIGFHAMDQGFVRATGTVNLPAHESGWFETIITETEMKVSSLQLRDFLQAGAAINKLPQGEGIVNADFHMRAVGLDDIEIKGLAELTDVTLSGGFLGKDQPSFQKVHLTVEEGRWTGHGWSAKGFELVSDTLNMKASGKLFSETTELSAEGILNLPVLFDQVPRFLRVNESTFVETGILDFTVELNDNSPDSSLKFKAKANNIGGIFQDKRFSWDSPALLLFNGDKKGTSLQVNALQLDAPFGRAKGSGGLHSFSMDAVLDLDKALTDIGTLFQLDLAGSGKMELTVQSDLAENEVDKFKVDADLNINDFKLHRHDQSIVPLNQFTLIGSFKAPNTYVDQRNGELDIQIVLSSWLGEVFFVMNGEKPEAGLFKGYYTTDSELDLGKITTLLHTFNMLDSKTRMAGTMQLQSAGFAGGAPLEIRDLSVEISKFVLEGNGALFNESRVKVDILQPINEDVPFLSVRELKVAKNKEGFFRSGAGLNLIDFSARNVTLNNVQLEAKSVSATIDSLVIPNWLEPFNGIRSQFSISADLDKMTEAFQSVGLLSGDTSFSGSSQATFLLAGKDKLTQEMSLNAQIDGFSIKHLGKMLAKPKAVVFSSLLHGQVPFGVMTVDELKLQSDILNLDATGKITSFDEKQVLELSGSMIPVWEKFASIMGKKIGTDVTMTGQKEEQFIVKYPLWKKPSESIAQLVVFSSFNADTVVLNGIEYREVSLPFHFDNGNLHVELSSQMGGGKVEAVTDTDFTAAQKIVMIPENSQVMTGVELNDLLVSKLFSKIHPLFGVFAQPSGSIDVRLDTFRWPIDAKEKNRANFISIFDVREVKLESQAILKDILTTFGLEKGELRLLDTEIYCISKNGKTKCSPVRLLIGDTEITVGGVVYFDNSFDYKVEVPITQNLVSVEGYQILKGTTVKVNVKGTTKAPYFDKDEVKANIQNLMKQAAKKIVPKKDETMRHATGAGG